MWNAACGLLFHENRSVVEGLKGRELAEGHVMSVGAVEGLKGRELVECHVIMSSVASAIPTSNHNTNECGLSVLWHDCSCSQQSSPKISNDFAKYMQWSFPYLDLGQEKLHAQETNLCRVASASVSAEIWCLMSSNHECTFLQMCVLIENEHHRSKIHYNCHQTNSKAKQGRDVCECEIYKRRAGHCLLATTAHDDELCASSPDPLS
jgi:hypothetical protein